MDEEWIRKYTNYWVIAWGRNCSTGLWATDSRETGEMFRGFGRKILWLCTEGTSAWLLHWGGGSLPTVHLLCDRAGTTRIYLRLNYIEKSSFDIKISTASALQRPAVFCRQAASQLHVFAWISCNQTTTTNPISWRFILTSSIYI
jgi:hypothetical protein